MKGSKLPIEPIYSRYFGEGGILAMKAKKKLVKREAVAKAVSKRKSSIVSYGTVKPAAQVEAESKPPIVVKDGLKEVASREALMKEAQGFGIKNFRVLNKAELTEAVGIARAGNGQDVMHGRIKEIVEGAVSRWKSGWSKK